MIRPIEVVCAGILVADHVCTPMDRLPDAGHLVKVDGMSLFTGGCAANVAADLAKQAVETAVVGRVGEDYWGRFVRDDLEAHGVETTHVAVSAVLQTSQTMVLLCRGEGRRFVHTFGANSEFRAADISRDALVGAKVLYVGGYLAMPGVDAGELAALFRWCREREIRTVLDVVIPSGFVYHGELEEVLPHTDVFLPNNDEAEMLTGEPDPVCQLRLLRQKGARTVVVTLGEAGLLFGEGTRIGRASLFPAELVDDTGAGDAFCAGFITGMVRGLDLEGCLQYGSALGASCVRAMGASGGVFTAEEAGDFLGRNRLEFSPVG